MSEQPNTQPEPAIELLLDEAEEQALVDVLRSAFAPAEIDPRRHEALLEQALEDPLAEPSAEELAEAELLRRALDDSTEHPDAALARALKAAAAPEPVPAAAEARALRAAKGTRRGSVVYVTFGVGAALAAVAASAALFLVPAEPRPELAVSRSTAPLFGPEFATQSTTERIDRIARERARELRDNRYALWGLK
jgi:hypothetical protein